MNDTQLAAFVTSFLSPNLILAHARSLGVLRRQSKFDLVLFVYTLVFSSFSASSASLAHFYRSYLRLHPSGLSRSAFYKRFDVRMAQLFEMLFEHLLRFALHQTHHWLHDYLDTFDGVLALDSTTVSLRKRLEQTWQACKQGHSALKLHAAYNVLDFQLHRVQFSSAKEHDILGIKHVKDFCRNCLLLFDLGYYSHDLFATIDKHKGYYISRLKDKTEPKIIEEQERGRGRPARLAGRPLRVVLGELTRQQLDVKVWLGKQRLEARVVGGRDKEGKWRLYVTNLPSEVYSSEEVIELYRARWQVELLFKQLKSQGGLDTLEGKTEATVKIQMYAILMGYVVCSALLGGARRRRDAAQVSMRRGLEGLRVMGGELVELLYEGVQPWRRRRGWMERFESMSIDPNVHRRRYVDPLIRTSTLSDYPGFSVLSA